MPASDASEPQWHRIFDLADHGERLRTWQHLAWDHPGGFVPAPHVVGSPGWWRALERGELETVELVGEVVRRFGGALPGWPFLTLRTDDGHESTWTPEWDAEPEVGDRLRLRHTWPVVKPTAVADVANRRLPIVLTVDLDRG